MAYFKLGGSPYWTKERMEEEMSKAKELIKLSLHEAVGEGEWEKLTKERFQHLEVGVDYNIHYRRHTFPAIFSGWVDKDGKHTESENPEEVDLEFKDPEDGSFFQLFWDADQGCYVIGSSSDPVEVRVHDETDPAGGSGLASHEATIKEDSDAQEMESFLKPLGFRPMTGDDYDGFAGAAEDSWILNGNWGDMIAEPSGQGVLIIPFADEINFDWEKAPLKKVIDALNKDNALHKAIEDHMANDNPGDAGVIGSKHDVYKDMLAGKLDPNPSKDNPVNNGERWVLSMDGHALEKDFHYEKGEEAYKNLKEIVKDHPGVEVTQLGYDDMSVILPAGTQKSQALELAHRIANALPYETSKEWKEQYGEDVLGDIHTMDSDGAVLDLARGDSADSIKVNKGDKMEAKNKAQQLLGLCTEEEPAAKAILDKPTKMGESKQYDKHAKHADKIHKKMSKIHQQLKAVHKEIRKHNKAVDKTVAKEGNNRLHAPDKVLNKHQKILDKSGDIQHTMDKIDKEVN